MTTTAEKLKTELVELPAHDRANLAHFLIQSLPLPPAMTEREFDAELEKRAREIQEGKANGEPVEKVIAELRENFREIRQRSFRRAPRIGRSDGMV